MAKRQPRTKQYRKVYPKLELANYIYVNDYDPDSSLAANINRIIEEHRKYVSCVLKPPSQRDRVI